jgi:hypothetical protein
MILTVGPHNSLYKRHCKIPPVSQGTDKSARFLAHRVVISAQSPKLWEAWADALQFPALISNVSVHQGIGSPFYGMDRGIGNIYIYISVPKTRFGVLPSRFGVLRSRTSFCCNSCFHVFSFVWLLRSGCVLNVLLTTCRVQLAAFWFCVLSSFGCF